MVARIKAVGASITKITPTYRAALYMMLAMLVFGIANSIIKSLTGIPVMQLVGMRSVCAFIALMSATHLFFPGGVKAVWKTQNRILQFARSGFSFLALNCLFLSFQWLPLADATAFSFCVPLFVTALSALLMGESVGWRRWTAIGIGFVGVMIMARPSGEVSQNGVLIALVTALLDSIVMLLVRRLGSFDHPFTTISYQTVGVLTLCVLLNSDPWHVPNTSEAIRFVFLGVLAVSGHVLIASACRLAPPSVVSPMLYTLIIWGVSLGYFVWGEVPHYTFWLGLPILMGCGGYIIYREGQLEKK